ncbi:MAG: RNA polymerase sigma factor RpoD/SigA [Candidatus Cloacimonetes bacterium]|nr:RNA polymerase sigma factor RpoD/SigA [Candidatus Cloacimonadota bacterium]
MAENVFEDKGLQNYLNEIASVPTLSREEEHELALKAKAGDQEAMNILIMSNLKFVVKIAAKFQNRGMKLSELISEGNMGLLKALEKFEPDKDIKLISYAVWWIKQRIMFALAEKTSVIRIPIGKTNSVNKLKAIKDKKLTATGNSASMEELIAQSDMNKKQIKKLDFQNIEVISFDDVASQDEKMNLLKVIPDSDAIDPKNAYFDDRIMTVIEQSISQLDSREQFIINKYFGLDGEDSQNYAKISEKLNISRERVRQLQKEALTKILHDVTKELGNDINSLIVD